MEISAILFDLDGVLCSTDRFHYRAWKELADRLGLPFNEEINRQLRGVSRMESLEILLRGSERKFTFQEKAALAEENNRRYRCLPAGPADPAGTAGPGGTGRRWPPPVGTPR